MVAYSHQSAASCGCPTWQMGYSHLDDEKGTLGLSNYDKHMSRRMGKPTICIGENKGADQLRSNCEADQRFCFRYSHSTISLLLKSEISGF